MNPSFKGTKFLSVFQTSYVKVRKFQNENMKSSQCPKYEKICPKSRAEYPKGDPK
jgi:hypothetical protein